MSNYNPAHMTGGGTGGSTNHHQGSSQSTLGRQQANSIPGQPSGGGGSQPIPTTNQLRQIASDNHNAVQANRARNQGNGPIF